MAQRASQSSGPAGDDPYAVLGVARTATDAEIKKAYRKLVRTSHPDINPDDPEAEARFVKITAANDLLKDPETRARFDAGEIDAAGHEKPRRSYYRDYADAGDARRSRGPDSAYGGGPGGAPGGGPGGGFGGGFEGGFGGADPDDIFAEFFRQRGGGGGARGAQGFSAPGPDHGYRLEISFLDAARGAKTRITLPGDSTLEVTIPAGLRDGQTLRLRGKGGEGFGGGPRGDAQVTVTVLSHPFFRREGDDIHVTLPITLDEAVLGARVSAPTIDGEVSLTVPKGSSGGRVLRLRGRGVQGREARGDQLVELRVVVPKTEDPELTAFMETWRKTAHENPRKAMMEGAPK